MALTHVADDDEFLAAQMNAVMDYIQSTSRGVNGGHTHTGADNTGPQISHTDLLDGAIAGRTHSHQAIDAHIGATAGTGASGVHGLSANVYVPGTANSGLVFASGWAAKTGDNYVITTSLSTITGVVVTPSTTTWTNQYQSGPSCLVGALTNVAGASTFRVRIDGGDTVTGVCWLAWGTK